MAKQIKLVIEPDGCTRHLVDSTSESIGAVVGPKLSTRRSSHVESWSDLSDAAKGVINDEHGSHEGMDAQTRQRWENLFWADLLPSNGPVLGPFPHYAMAIAAEVQWLSQHHLPLPCPA